MGKEDSLEGRLNAIIVKFSIQLVREILHLSGNFKISACTISVLKKQTRRWRGGRVVAGSPPMQTFLGVPRGGVVTVKRKGWELRWRGEVAVKRRHVRKKHVLIGCQTWRVLPPNIWSLNAVKASCRAKGEGVLTCFWSASSAHLLIFSIFSNISQSETAHLLLRILLWSCTTP